MVQDINCRRLSDYTSGLRLGNMIKKPQKKALCNQLAKRQYNYLQAILQLRWKENKGRTYFTPMGLNPADEDFTGEGTQGSGELWAHIHPLTPNLPDISSFSGTVIIYITTKQ